MLFYTAKNVTEDNKYIMYCGNDKHIIFCKKTYDILKKIMKKKII